MHESRVANLVDSASGVDTSDPKTSEVSLLLLSIAEGVAQASFELLFSLAEVFASRAIETSGKLEDFLVSLSSNDSSFNSWHFLSFTFSIYSIKV